MNSHTESETRSQFTGFRLGSWWLSLRQCALIQMFGGNQLPFCSQDLLPPTDQDTTLAPKRRDRMQTDMQQRARISR